MTIDTGASSACRGITRRTLLIALGAGAVVSPLASLAQQHGKVWRVGILGLGNLEEYINSNYSTSFLQGMRELGYVEGKNLTIDRRFADHSLDRLPELATELVRMNPDVLVAGGNDAPLALHKATTTIPVVMTAASDPVGLGLINGLARPGGNITGISTVSGDLGVKRLELLLDMLPKLSRVAVLVNPTSAGNVKTLESIQVEGRKRHITVLRADAQTPQEIDNAIRAMRQQNAGALIISLHPFFQEQKNQIAELSLKHRLPAMTPDPVYPEVGCLMSYGSNLADGAHRAATYVDKIFKGARPADLPVEEPTKFELVINGKTAKALRLKIPQSILVRADKVIE